MPKFHIHGEVDASIIKRKEEIYMIHRIKKLTFRVTEEELLSIKKKVHQSGISQQQFLLKAALEKEIICIKEFQALMLQIKKIGTNINQISKHSNETWSITDPEIEELKEGLNQIWQLLKLSKIHTQA